MNLERQLNCFEEQQRASARRTFVASAPDRIRQRSAGDGTGMPLAWNGGRTSSRRRWRPVQPLEPSELGWRPLLDAELVRLVTFHGIYTPAAPLLADRLREPSNMSMAAWWMRAHACGPISAKKASSEQREHSTRQTATRGGRPPLPAASRSSAEP